MGSPVPVLGVPVPKLRAIVAGFRRGHRDIDACDLNRLASRLWERSTFEEKATAISLLDAYSKILDDASCHVLDTWVDEATGWGLCDWLALGPIATIVHREPRRFREILRWTRSRNPWRRRIAVYSTRDFVFAGELERPMQVFERLLYDDEFWVQWAGGRGCAKAGRKIVAASRPSCGTMRSACLR